MRRVLIFFGIIVSGISFIFSGNAMNPGLEDPYSSTYVMAQDTVPPRYDDYITSPGSNPFDLQDPSIVDQHVEYDPVTGNYIITEKIGDFYYRPPTYMSFDDFLKYQREKEQSTYFKRLSGVTVDGAVKARNPIENLNIDFNPLDKLFGGTDIKIDPQGSIDLTFGLDHQNTDNPFLTPRQARNTTFDFDMDIKMGVKGKIGEKLDLTFNYDTKATFNFDKQIKLDYNSDLFGEDDIIKRIEAGDVSLPLKGTLIQGAQSLFGLKTELQFGPLRVTALASQQRSQNKNIRIEGGAQKQEFELNVDQYDENRHFFLSHYNRDSYEEALADFPYVKSVFRLRNIQVWVTNDQGEVQSKDLLAFTDLGESNRLTNPDDIHISADAPKDSQGRILPTNDANDLFDKIRSRPGVRTLDQAIAILQSEFGLVQGRDFEKINAYQLQPSQYTYNAELGYISLNVNLRPDQVLSVSYQYDYNLKQYEVGEMSTNIQDESPGTGDTQLIYTKMLKSTAQRVNTPSWDLMMKNVYAIGAYQVEPEDFLLDVFYDDPGKGLKRFLPTSVEQGKPLLRVFNLDRLNSQQDPQPDGRFDFVEGITINSRSGRIFFPVLEPFGKNLAEKLVSPQEREKYVYEDLYQQTPFQALENTEKNRFKLKGSFQSEISAEISLGAFNIPEGSVRVRAGGKQLIEYKDYEINYSSGRLRILNDAYLASGVPIDVSFEDNTVFAFQSKTMLGLRADYEVNKHLNIGATALKLFERPFTQKVNIGEDPINNSIYGLDFTFSKESPWLTKMVNSIPLISTKAPSSVNITAETAYLRPGHAKAINAGKDKGGVVYLDDFEGSSSSIDIHSQPNLWFLASVPQNDTENNNPLFPEANASGVTSGVNRARLAWYRVFGSGRNTGFDPDQARQAPYTSPVPIEEVFPNKDLNNTTANINYPLDLTFWPEERGPYNFDLPGGVNGYSEGVKFGSDSTILLNAPETRWAGIMRELTTTDFQAANIEFLEFWTLSPFLSDTDASMPATDVQKNEGSLYINIGNVSEDILKDSRRFYENGLPTTDNPNRKIVNTSWGNVPVRTAITQSFDNQSVTARTEQDVGLDGLNDLQEIDQFENYINAIAAVNSNAGLKLREDPSNDDFVSYRDPAVQNLSDQRLQYKRYNDTEGNSKSNRNVQSNTGNTNDQIRQSSTNQPDTEDINKDNSLNETESYFQYEIPLKSDPFNPREIDQSKTPFITDKREDPATNRIWYRFRIPLRTSNKKAVGGISDFRSIRFVRMYMQGFQNPTTLRFASLELVRNQWRRYTKDLSELPADLHPACGSDSELDIDAVNFEENGGRLPFNYVLPLGIVQEEAVGGYYSVKQNEQSLALKVSDICDGDGNGVFKLVETDMRLYERMQMFVHAENTDEMDQTPEGALRVFIRLGSDIQNNYYEYEVPLRMSDPSVIADEKSTSGPYRQEVWPESNSFDFPLSLLKELKVERNDANFDINQVFSKLVSNKNGDKLNTVKVKGNPNLGNVKVAMIGVRNPYDGDGRSYSTEVWVNELRLTGLDERGGYAGVARMDVQLADFANVSLSGNVNSIGFGALDDKVQDRNRERVSGYDLALDMNLDKFFPQKWGVSIPFHGQISNTTITPEYDPYDLDIPLKEKLNAAVNQTARDSIQSQAREVTNIKTYNFTNVRKQAKSGKKPTPLDISNFSASYSYNQIEKQDALLEFEREKQQNASLDYAYNHSAKYLEPFKKIKSKQLKLIKNINFNPIPNSFTVANNFDRRFQTTRYRFTGLADKYNTYYAKYFKWDRDYSFNWDLTKSIKFNFNATASSVIDEPDETRMQFDPTIEDIPKYRKDSILSNIKNLGRPKSYMHNLNASYKLPLRYLPYMEWVGISTQYQASYSWQAASLVSAELGNVINNSQNRQATIDLNFTKLYDQSKYLKSINKGKPRKRKKKGKKDKKVDTGKKSGADKKDAKKKKSKRAEPSDLARVIIRPLMLLRRAKVNYSQRYQTTVPGFAPQSKLLGLSSGFDSPGWDFVAGIQPKIRTLNPDTDYYGPQDWLYNNKNWITKTPNLNQDVIQLYTENFDAKVTIEPFKDFKIDVTAQKTFTEDYSSQFKVPEVGSDYQHGSPIIGGAMTVSYSGLKTLFKDSDAQVDAIFNEFIDNQVIISQRLGKGNHVDADQSNEGYRYGYGAYQQELLVPSFIAAYSGQDARTMDLDLFKTRPSVNWSLKYNGLSKIPLFQDIFKNFSLTHTYKSSLTINRYSTNNSYFASENANPFLNHYNAETNNFYTRLEIPQLSITESFAPLIGVEMTMENGLNLNVDYSKSRNLSLATGNNILQEQYSKEISVGFGYKLSNVDIPFLTGSKKKKGKKPKKGEEPKKKQGRRGGSLLQAHDLDFHFDMSLRDDKTYARKLGEGNQEPVSGSYNLTLSPSVEYKLNKQLSLRAFFDYRKVIPKTVGYKRVNSTGGIKVRFEL